MRPALLAKLNEALNKIDRLGSFCASGSVPTLLPGLEVTNLGPIGLPLTAKQAKELKKLCEQAPYGKGEDTIVDTSVRRVWRLKPDRFRLTNPDWQPLLQEITKKVQEELGLEKQKLECHLYDLLLYEKGSFFLPHRDGEKHERMIATLVVALPSSFEGGELVVRQDGQAQTIDFRNPPNSPLQIHYAAFYADCEHEVRPLREGHRLCLVYNLTLAKTKKSIAAPRDSDHIATIRQLLHEWSTLDEARKLVFTLDHQYTQEGLAWDALKGVDRARARILREAAGAAGCQVNLALLTFWESGSAADDGSDYGYGQRRRRYYDDDEDEEGEEDIAGLHEMDEVFESSLTAEHWIDSDGKRLPIAKLTVAEDEVLGPEALRKVEPEEAFEGYTGNEGMTLERWYRHAALILWPENRYAMVLCDGDGKKVVPMLQELVAQWTQAGPRKAPVLKAKCLDLATAMLAAWKENPHGRGHFHYAPVTAEQPETGDLLGTLAELDDPRLIAGFLGQVMIKDASIEPGKSLPALCQKYGWETFQRELLAVMKGTNADTLARNARLLEQLCLAKPRKKQGWSELCQTLAQSLLATLEEIDQDKPTPYWRPQPPDRAEVVADLARALLATEQDDLLARLVTHTLATPKNYPLTVAHVPALVRLRPWLAKNLKQPSAALTKWLATCREQLETLTAQAPQEPTDFRRAASVTCKCQDCTELKRFLENPSEPVHRFSVREDRRKHLHNCIQQHHCDVDCQTDRCRSPYTLVCTKNTASYKEALKTYHQNQEHLATVRSIQATRTGPVKKARA